MKNRFFITAIFLFTIGSFFSNAQYSKEFLQMKADRYRKMQTSGFVLLGSGSAAMITGAILISSADWTTTTDMYGNTNHTTDDPVGFAGVGVCIVGFALMASGTVFTIIGTSKTKSYQQKLHNLSIAPCITPKQAGFQLTYRF